MRTTRTALLVLVLLAAHYASAESLPLFSSHSKRKLIDNVFAKSEDLLNAFSSGISQQAKTIVVEIETPHSIAETAQIVRQAQSQMPTFAKLFVNNQNAFVTMYAEYNAQEFVDRLSDLTGAKVVTYDINTNFAQQHQKALKSGAKSSIEFIKVPLSLLQRLESVLQNDVETLRLENVDDFNFIVLFQQSLNNVRLLKQEAEEAQSQEIDSPVATGSTQMGTNLLGDSTVKQTTQRINYYPSYIQPSTLFAYLMFLFIGYALYISLVAQMDLKAPRGFIKDNLNVGRES